MPAQSLTLLNDRLVIDLARRWAERTVGPGSPAASLGDGAAKQRIAKMFIEALGRDPNDDEMATCIGYLRRGMGQDQVVRREADRLAREATRCRDQLAAITGAARQRLLAGQGADGAAPCHRSRPICRPRWPAGISTPT